MVELDVWIIFDYCEGCSGAGENPQMQIDGRIEYHVQCARCEGSGVDPTHGRYEINDGYAGGINWGGIFAMCDSGGAADLSEKKYVPF